MEDASVRVERKAVPQLRVPDNIVEVRYTIHLHNKLTGLSSTLEELHIMRYWSVPELRGRARSAGFLPLDCGAWMELSPPRRETWCLDAASPGVKGERVKKLFIRCGVPVAD